MFVLLMLILGLALVVLPIWALIRSLHLTDELSTLRRHVTALEGDIQRLRQQLQAVATPPPVPQREAPVAPAARTPAPAVVIPTPVLPPIISSAPAPQVAPRPAVPVEAIAPVIRPPQRHAPAINWEQFMGAKLFAWLGGLAAFLAVAFFVKYSFEHDLIPPQVRVALGYLLGAGLLAGGVSIKREKLRITSQVLCATGVVSLYAVTFACHAVYHFAFFGPVATFVLMAVITATAFLLSVRLNAQVVAILGLLAGFLTPVLLSTGRDNPGGLFGFIALLDLGLIAVALNRRWYHLVPLALAGTFAMQLGWTEKFFEASKAPVAITIVLGFSALFAGATEVGRRFGRDGALVTWSAIAQSLAAFGFAIFFLTFPSIALRPGLLLSLVFGADVILLALAWRDPLAHRAHLLASAAAFVVLGLWSATALTTHLLPWALAACLLFAVLHTAFPLLLARHRPEAADTFWSQLFPPLTLLLFLAPLVRFDEVSWLFWPAVLLVDVIAVGLALATASLLSLAVVLVLTIAATGVCIFKTSAELTAPGSLLFVIAGFAVFFFAAGLFLARRLGARLQDGTRDTTASILGGTGAQIPAFAALLPFTLLVMMSQRLSFSTPTSLFGLGLLLSVLTLGLARLLLIEWLPLCALIGTAALEYAWHVRLFTTENATVSLAWYAAFYALFSVFPFLFRRNFVAMTGPWALSALAGLPQFWLIHDTIRRTWPNDIPGLLPAFFALAPLAGLVVILRGTPADPVRRLNQLAWFGGAALFFITLIFPIQFDRQWITLGWAFEGAALLWLFGRVPHPGLRATGVALLVAAFARLALNRAVLTYQVRSDTPIFNWYLYTYGLVTLSLFVGAWLVRRHAEDAEDGERVFGVNAVNLLNSLGTVLAFLLLNLEIADYFSATGSRLIFEFSGSFARDVSYTVGWALFALALLGAGIWRGARAARYAALALLSVTLLKLFFHDLAQLSQLYRVGALIAVAAVAIVASFLYQRFVPNDQSPPSET